MKITGQYLSYHMIASTSLYILMLVKVLFIEGGFGFHENLWTIYAWDDESADVQECPEAAGSMI